PGQVRGGIAARRDQHRDRRRQTEGRCARPARLYADSGRADPLSDRGSARRLFRKLRTFGRRSEEPQAGAGLGPRAHAAAETDDLNRVASVRQIWCAYVDWLFPGAAVHGQWRRASPLAIANRSLEIYPRRSKLEMLRINFQ